MNNEMKPLAKWDANDSQHPDLVWWSRLDNKFQCEVQRTGDRDATLIVFDHACGDIVIHQEPTTLSYGAVFGPDVADVSYWQERCIQIVDNLGKGED